MQRTVRVNVHGLVQGVGFRFFALRVAERCGVHGTVRNASDGQRVEAVVQGSPSAVDAFVAELRRGPAGSDVRDVVVTAIAEPELYDDFRVIQ